MTEPAHLTAVRESYDTVAADYLRRVVPPEGMDPLSRAMLAAFAEFHRVLAPGGHLLLGGHTGDEEPRPSSAYGHPVTWASHLVPAGRLVALLAGAGFTVTTRLEQARPERPERGYVSLLAHA
ncbi:hypothetical protein ABTY61_29860 [Kitasatospora sp. NPDC096128]|uniref:hypothetical protein n=1 Tax=Kitasatospora sp. NPDC096128 TaxID=3155547 RepID=UPI0033309EC5